MQAPPDSRTFLHNIHVKPKALRTSFLQKKFDENGDPRTEFARKVKEEALRGEVYVHLPITVKNELNEAVLCMQDALCKKILWSWRECIAFVDYVGKAYGLDD